MSRYDKKLSETDIRPPDGTAWTIRADDADSRDWLAKSPVCPELGRHRIRHLAVAQMPAPFEIVRAQLGGIYFLACFGGEGRVLVDGRWAPCRPGQAFLLPPGKQHAVHTKPGSRWDFCWVRYHEQSGQFPLTSAQTPVVARFDSESLRYAILGLFHECQQVNRVSQTVPRSQDETDTLARHHWVDLVHHYVLRFAAPNSSDPRIGRLWNEVAQTLGEPWTISDMADRVHLSEKQFQRLCLKELGRTPKQHLIWLRMRHASELLGEMGSKIETIANQVGYSNPFVFSTTFKRVMGWSPSEYPGR
jgi:AraC-like DNA-binding protein